MLATSRSKDFQRSLQKKHAPWDVKKLMSNLSMRQFAKKSVTLAKNIVYKKVTLLQIIWAINKNTIPKKYSIIKNKFSYLFENVPEILLAPIELECHKRIKQNQHYLGLCVRPREDIAIPKEFEASFQKVKLQKELSGGKLIYCSFGSYSTDVVEQKEVFYFILALVEAVSCVPKIQVICSVGGIVANALETHAINPTNFYYFSRVPQLKVLGQCDLFITHGGLNSIKESIHFGVPMLVFPLDLNYDQNDNGYSVEYHGLGLTGDLRNEEPDLIKQKIMQLLWDESYKNRVKEFNQNLKQKYSEESARAKLVELFS